MTIKEFIIEETMAATNSLFRVARATPVDKLDWRPLDEGRSVISQCQECAQSPDWGKHVLTDRKLPEFTPEFMEAIRKEREPWKTVDDCERVCRERLENLFEAIRQFPEEDLNETIFMPFGEGSYWPYRDIMTLHRWNCHYHIGQISYIQTLYGDKEMH